MRKSILRTAALIGGLTAASHGQTWDGDTSTDFFTADNWAGGVAPDETQQVIINNISDGTTFAPSLAGGNYNLNPPGAGGDLFVGGSGTAGVGGVGTLDIDSGGSLNVSDNWLFIGNQTGTAAGTVNVNSGGSITGNAEIHLGRDGATGTLNINDGGSVNLGAIANDGGGTTNLSGDASVTTSGAFTGAKALSGWTGSITSGGTVSFQNGTSFISGNTVSSGGEFWVGNGGGDNATLNFSSGTITSNAWVAVGRDGSTGVLNMDGGTLTQTNNFLAPGSDLGQGAGNGTVNQTAGTVSAPGARLGENGASVGAYNISGGSLNLGADPLEIGWNATTTGSLNVSSSATVTSTGQAFVGRNDTATGTLSVTGSGATISLGNLAVGLDENLADSGSTGTIAFVADVSGISTINVAGDVNLSSPDGDNLSVDLSAWFGTETDDVLLINGLTSQGEFNGLAQGATVPGANGGTIDYSETGKVWLRNVTVPEPSITLLGGLGLLGLLRRRRQD